jgi:hypothetical protein
VGSPTAIERDTGWQAGTTLEQTLDDLLEAWRARVADPGPKR